MDIQFIWNGRTAPWVAGGPGFSALQMGAGGAWQFSLAIQFSLVGTVERLVYECQRETDDDRAARRADTIRRRLGWGAGIANPEGGKPKGMHLRTFVRLKPEDAAFANVAWGGDG